MDSGPQLTSIMQGERLELAAGGCWTAPYAAALEPMIAGAVITGGHARTAVIDMTAVRELDTFGAWLLERLVRSCELRGLSARITGLPERYAGLIEQVHRIPKPGGVSSRRSALSGELRLLRERVEAFAGSLTSAVAMLGAVGYGLGRALLHPRRFRLTSMVHHLDRVGWQAIPIILLITFLIGAIIAQQGFFHFRRFGADAYVVDMVGILVLRELGVLIVAIMVAGRSGSAYTAELGSMKMREEIDALRTMGLDPVEVLIVPRILALVIALPVLTFLGALAALYGGGLVAWLYGGMSPEIYIERLREAISTVHFQVGMIKAPFMALVIGVIACNEGLQVQGSAESLGLKTTTSVVKSIFMVIVLDGLFAIFFASIGM